MIDIFFSPVAPCPPIPGVDNSVDCEESWRLQAESMAETSFKIGYAYLGVIAASLVGYSMLYWGFGVATERMNRRVRDAAFSSLARQEVAWYDVRSAGAITSRLSDDAALLHAYAGEPIRTLVASLSSVLVGVVVSFVLMWNVLSMV